MRLGERMSPGHGVRRLLTMMALIAVPAAIALRTVEGDRPKLPIDPQPTPLGYTWSLLFFILPALFLGVWFHRQRNVGANRKAFWISLSILFGLGAGLDVFFGTMFFTFVNRGATLGIDVPVVGGAVPIEEFGFYSFGFAAILLVYLWAHEDFLPGAQLVRATPSKTRRLRDLVSVSWQVLAGGGLLFAAAWWWKSWGPRSSEGFPGYFLFLLLVGVAPTVVFYRAVATSIDWAALSLTAILLLPISLLWEGVLASPYQWWGYRPEMMIGIDIDALSGLPIEAVLLWFVAAWAGVTIYEVCRRLEGVVPAGEETAGAGNG